METETREINLSDLELKYAKLRVGDRQGEGRLLINLDEEGQQSPIIVSSKSGVARWVLIDGYKRVRALKRLKRDVASATLWRMPPEEALLRAYQTSCGRHWNAIEEGWLVAELYRVEKWDLARIGKSMSRTKSWVSRRLGLVESLPEVVLEEVQRGKISAYVAMKYLVPLARANRASCEKLAEKIGKHELKTRQVALVYLHGMAERGKRMDRIVEDPVTFLKAVQASGQGVEPTFSEGESWCFKNLQLVRNVSVGLARRLPEVMTGETRAPVRTKLWGAWLETEQGFEWLQQKLQPIAPPTPRKKAI